MDSRQVFLVVFVISSVVPYTKANGIITPLNYNFTNSDCGTTKLCVQKPTSCDPSGTSECFFVSMRINLIDSYLAFELSGNSTGYIALAAGVVSDLSKGLHDVFVCGIDNGTVFFKTAVFKNINKTLEERSFPNVSNIQCSLKNQSLIQCAFTIPIHLSSNNTLNIFDIDFNITNIPVFLEVYQGSYNGTIFGAPMSAFGSSFPVDLADVKSSSATNSISSTTSKPNTTAAIPTSRPNTTTTPNTTATIPTTTINTTTTTPNTTLNTTATIPSTTPNTTITIPTTTTYTTTTPNSTLNTTVTIPTNTTTTPNTTLNTTTTNTTTTPITTLNTTATIPTNTTITPNTTLNTTATIPTTTSNTTLDNTATIPTTTSNTTLDNTATISTTTSITTTTIPTSTPNSTTTIPTCTPNTTATMPPSTPTTKAASTIKPTTKPSTNDSTSLFSHAALGLLAAVALHFL